MHRESDVARWYRRVDPSCFTTQPASYEGQETGAVLVFGLPDDAGDDQRALWTTAKPISWLGYVARRLGATGA